MPTICVGCSARAARPCRHVRRRAHRARVAGRARRACSSCTTRDMRRCAATASSRRRRLRSSADCVPMPGGDGTDRRLRHAGRHGARARAAARRPRVERARSPACPSFVLGGRRAASRCTAGAACAPTSRTAARSLPSSTPSPPACRSTRLTCPSCAGMGVASRGREGRGARSSHPLEPGLRTVRHDLHRSAERRARGAAQRHGIRARRSGSLAMRRRDGGGAGGAGRDGPPRSRTALRAREPHRDDVQRPAVRTVGWSGTCRRFCPRWKARPGSPESTPSSPKTTTRWQTGSVLG